LHKLKSRSFDGLHSENDQLSPTFTYFFTVSFFDLGNVGTSGRDSLCHNSELYMPLCYSNYKKNGEPSENAKPELHHHGSNGNVYYRVIRAMFPHCLPERNQFLFNIYITDITVGAKPKPIPLPEPKPKKKVIKTKKEEKK